MSEIITCPSGLTGRIRGMKVREERVLADRKLAKSGGQVDELLVSCWTETLDPGPYDFGDKVIDWGKVLQGDHATVANNLNYVLMTAVAYWFTARDNPISVDRFHEEALGAVAVGGKPPLRGPVARETVTTRRDGSA